MLPQPNNFPSSSTFIKCSSIHKHKNMSRSKCPFLKTYLVPTKIPPLTYPSTEEVTQAFLSLNCSSEVDGFCPHLKEVKVYNTAEGKILYQIASPCRACQGILRQRHADPSTFPLTIAPACASFTSTGTFSNAQVALDSSPPAAPPETSRQQ